MFEHLAGAWSGSPRGKPSETLMASNLCKGFSNLRGFMRGTDHIPSRDVIRFTTSCS
jgi:hypothetical protein